MARSTARPTYASSSAAACSSPPTRQSSFRCCRASYTCAARNGWPSSCTSCTSWTTSRAQRSARDVVLARLLEVLLIEALRGATDTETSPGLVRGLADARLANALRALHEAPAQAWTVADLAHEATLSSSGFFERFSRTVGMAPMPYMLTWRMALTQDLLRRGSIAEVAERVGYIARHVGVPPGSNARAA